MVATVDIIRSTGGTVSSPGSTVSVSGLNVRADLDDSHDATGIRTTYPVRIPEAGLTYYSHWISTQLYLSNIDTSTTINNIMWYTEGTTPGTGVGLQVAMVDSGLYYPSQISGVGISASGLINHPNLGTTVDDATSYTTSNKLAVSGTLTANGQYSNYVVYQFTVDSTASAGKVPSGTPLTITWQYDET